jgi:EmrB/QacA subfamily drug resistance transporter
MTRSRAHISFAALLIILFLTFLDNTIISAILTSVQSKLHAGVPQLQWVVGGYALTFATFMLIFGSIGDILGRKKVMLVGVLIFIIGAVACAVSLDLKTLITGRMIMGLGAAASEPATLALISRVYAKKTSQSKAFGLWAAVSGLALAMGPILGGGLVSAWSWRSIFWFNVVFGVVALFVGLVFLPKDAPRLHRRIDWFGFLAGGIALSLGIYATIEGETLGYRSARIIELFGAAFIIGVLFYTIEKRTKEPMIKPSNFRIRAFSGSIFIAFASYFSIFAIFFFVALYLEIIQSVSAVRFAFDFLPLLLGIVISGIYSGRWMARVGSRTPLAYGCLISAVGLFGTRIVISPTVNYLTLALVLGISGIGFGLLVAPLNATAIWSLPQSESGVAASSVNTGREFGAVAGVAILGSMVNGQLTNHLMSRLIQLGIPAAFRSTVITAITSGTLNDQAQTFTKGASVSVKTIIDKVVSAAYGALSNGLNLALTAASILLLIASGVAFGLIPHGTLVHTRLAPIGGVDSE